MLTPKRADLIMAAIRAKLKDEPKLENLLEAMTFVILASRSEEAPRPWVERAKQIVKEFEA